jgi:hypothetical protein
MLLLRQLATLVALALQIGCAVSAGGVVAAPSGGPVVLGGPSAEAFLHLPSSFRMIVGSEWTRAATPESLWRAVILAGYSSPADGTRRLGWETSARLGYQRSWEGSRTAAAAVGGARAGAWVRLGERTEPWQGDPLVESTPLLVLDVGLSGLTVPGRPVQPEFNARLMLRFRLTSTLLP